jgi:selT/selW/selH-like putative selenoprotein
VAEIDAKTDAAATMIPGQTGQFDILADGRLIFSKQAEGRFPEQDEILGQLTRA